MIKVSENVIGRCKKLFQVSYIADVLFSVIFRLMFFVMNFIVKDIACGKNLHIVTG